MAGSIAPIVADIASAVAKVAPLLGTVLGSPLAGVGVSLLANAFGGKTTDLNDLLQRIISDPDTTVKLKQLENQHCEALQQIAAQNYSIEVEDRKSAREFAVNFHSNIPTYLAIGFLCVYSIVQFYIVMHPNSGLDNLSARFQDILMLIMSYYFGSSHKNSTEN